MKRKIAAIMAADVAGYSRLVAEDEEETLRRLASYRAVFDDFIERASGRVFNTAGDAILAEFTSAVEAVRCAIDVQESLRSRNLAYPASRQMNFRIGITIGDVVERDGDLLGDGVNIAARLEGLAEAGGVCVSRAVYEQVFNKLSVQFNDLGEQAVKNIPTPIHVFTLSRATEDGQVAAMPPRKKTAAQPRWLLPAAVGGVVLLCSIGVLGFFALGSGQPATQPAAVPAQAPQAPVAAKREEPLVPETVPYISDRDRDAIRAEYLNAAGQKALAISIQGLGLSIGQPDLEMAKNSAVENCKRTIRNAPDLQCYVYAANNSVVYAGPLPPLPPPPWFVRNSAVETPFTVKDVPFLSQSSRAELAKTFAVGHKPKAMAVSARGQWAYYNGQPSVDEAVRRALERCGFRSGSVCLVLAVDDSFVVPMPSTMKVTGLFRAASNAAIGSDAGKDLDRRLANAPNAWNAVAVGAAGMFGLKLNGSDERNAIDGALADCRRRDRDCRVIAIGPFAVEALEVSSTEATPPTPTVRQ